MNKNRVKAVRQQLRKNNIDCLITTRTANVAYITGFSGDDSWAVITPRAVYLITDSRYSEQARSQCANCKIIERKKGLAETAAGILKRTQSARTVAIENSTSIAALKALKKHTSLKIKLTAGIIEKGRRIKDESEIAAVRTAAKIAAEAFTQTRLKVKPGITENQLAGMLEFEIRRAGGQSSFDVIAAFGPNGSKAHHQPTDKKLKKNDYVLVDFGASYKGYCCDITRCFVVGRPKELRFYKTVYEAVSRAQKTAVNLLRPGIEFKKVDKAAREIIKKASLTVYGHGTGHGLGLEVHEQPAVSGGARGKFEEGMVLTIEPAVYIPGRFGIRIEDDYLITRDGCECLTISPESVQ